MQTAAEVTDKIIKLMAVITENYPELAKYLNEIPETIPDVKNPNLDVQTLDNYHKSLLDILRNYVAEHQLSYANRNHNNHHL